MDKVELTQIVKEVQKDIGQFELLYSQIINKVYFWCYTVVPNETIAKDMTQEAIIRIYTKIREVKKPQYFTSWMYRVVRNTCISYLRNNKKYESEFLYNDGYNEDFEINIVEERKDNLPEDAYDLKETKNLVINFINNLPKKQKEVITLYYLEEFKVEEIASILDYNAGSVKSRLHAGRKNLEQQINEYQKKNNVKLYNVAIFSLLGLILSEYRDEVCSNQNLAYDQTMYPTNNISFLGRILNLLSGKVIIASISVIVVGVATITYLNYHDEIIDLNNVNPSKHNVKLDEEIRKNPYIDSISYVSFPSRTSRNVLIVLENETKQEIEILFNEQEITYRKDGKNIVLQVMENGTYSIIVDDTEIAFDIDLIQKNAPELISVDNYGDYIKLNINDELSQIDYKKSYVSYRGKSYMIGKDLIINEVFQGEAEVVLFNREGLHIGYDIEL
ncbi:RNA polymerase sigma factor [Breznakia pachnodae]|uniref:RNA polymerase sigma factor (Sigma-70 family) n=1 Tax=Breznakia pachnodae TaxID=265178 RepID=A0ABU0E2E7_9FIRM|nr:RNA polymerase sigma factor [Breznakia pachnodae]MDQ0360934.1 RNA polymerase sigma factor (sigma-70 family) [Breznakia pachnodae]